jgi:hypothetical protein
MTNTKGNGANRRVQISLKNVGEKRPPSKAAVDAFAVIVDRSFGMWL